MYSDGTFRNEVLFKEKTSLSSNIAACILISFPRGKIKKQYWAGYSLIDNNLIYKHDNKRALEILLKENKNLVPVKVTIEEE